MTEEFSYLRREEYLNQLTSQNLDLIIVGGGITGAGILLDATTRGMKAALFEMQDFSQGTSSRSTKLVHGGLRYLKQFEFSLVKEVGRERAIVCFLFITFYALFVRSNSNGKIKQFSQIIPYISLFLFSPILKN